MTRMAAPILLACAAYVVGSLLLRESSPQRGASVTPAPSSSPSSSDHSLTQAKEQPAPPSVSSPNHLNEVNRRAMIGQISMWSGIPESKLLEMDPRELHAHAERWQAANLGKTVEEVRSMSPDESLNRGYQRIASKYGLTYDEVKRAADLQDKMDAGRRLTEDEKTFLQDITQKIKRRGR